MRTPIKERIVMVDRSIVEKDRYLTEKEKLNQVPRAVQRAIEYINIVLKAIYDKAEGRRVCPHLTLPHFQPRQRSKQFFSITGYDPPEHFPNDLETKDDIVIHRRRGVKNIYKAQINVDNPGVGSKGPSEPHVGWSVSRIGKGPNDPISGLGYILDKPSGNTSEPRSENIVTPQLVEDKIRSTPLLFEYNENSRIHKIVGHVCINENEKLSGRRK